MDYTVPTSPMQEGAVEARLRLCPQCPASKVHNKTEDVILSERGPKRSSVPGSPKSGLCSLGWSVGVVSGGGESKNLLCFSC